MLSLKTRVLRRTQLALSRCLTLPCVFCNLAQARDGICDYCREILPWNEDYCSRCGRALAARQPDNVPCADCQRSPPAFDKARAPLLYAYPVDRALKSIKFRRELVYAPVFGALLAPLLQAEFSHCDALWPVPLHRWRQARRGFNQAYEICRPLARRYGLRVLSDIARSKATRPQSGLSADLRRSNLRDAFSVPYLLRCRDPLIIDDVFTTGATVSQLSRVLRKAGARSVSVLTVATAG